MQKLPESKNSDLAWPKSLFKSQKLRTRWAQEDLAPCITGWCKITLEIKQKFIFGALKVKCYEVLFFHFAPYYFLLFHKAPTGGSAASCISLGFTKWRQRVKCFFNRLCTLKEMFFIIKTHSNVKSVLLDQSCHALYQPNCKDNDRNICLSVPERTLSWLTCDKCMKHRNVPTSE